MQTIVIKIYGKPIGRGIRSIGKTKTNQVFVNHGNEYKKWMKLIQYEAVCTKLPADWNKEGVFDIEILFILRRPNNHFVNSKRHNLIKKQFKDAAHISVPDLDNLEKPLLDGITKAKKIWVDDSHIFKKLSSKLYADYDAQIGAYISIQQIKPKRRENKQCQDSDI